MNKHLTPENRAKFIQLLEDNGCDCEKQHDEPEDATSAVCFGGSALYDLERLEETAKEMDEKLTLVEVEHEEALRELKEARSGLDQAKSDAYKVMCYEFWLQCLANNNDIDVLPQSVVVARLKSASVASAMILKDPSVFDPEDIALAAMRAREALDAGEVVSLDEFGDELQRRLNGEFKSK